MKKINLIYSLLAMFFFTLMACNGNDDDMPIKVEDLKLDTSQVMILEGKSMKVAITSGNGGYKVTSSDTEHVTATIQDNNVVITGKSSGEAQLTVTDAKDKTAFINVKVSASISLDKENIFLQKGNTATINVPTGEGVYTASSGDDNIATAEVNGDNIVITAVSVGETDITVMDSKTEQAKKIHVVVKEFMINETEVNLYTGESAGITIEGSDNYNVSIDNNDVASVETSDNTITITAKAAGSAKLTISDNDTNQQEIVNIIVEEKEELVLDKYSVSINRKGEEIIIITSYKDKPESYKDNYEINITEGSDKIKVFKQYYDGINHHVKVKSTGKLGNAKFVIRDKITNEEKEVAVTIQTIDFYILSLPETVTLEENETKVYNIKGNGEYTVSMTNNNVVEATATEQDEDEYGVLRIKGVNAGGTQLTVTDNATGQSKTVDVTVEAVAKDFVVDANGVLIEVNPSAIVPELVIPEYVKVIPSKYDHEFFNGNSVITKVTMKGVVQVGKYSFSSMENLTEVILGSNVEKIDQAAFALNKKLAKVTIHATTPPELEKYIFASGMDKSNRTLYVPNSALSQYQTEAWQDYFENIVGF